MLNLSGGVSHIVPISEARRTNLENIASDSQNLKDDFCRVANDYAKALENIAKENIANQQTN